MENGKGMDGNGGRGEKDEWMERTQQGRVVMVV
jgi:hypothetical protein